MTTAITSYDSLKNLAEVIRMRSGAEGGIAPRAFAQEVAKLDLTNYVDEYIPQHFVAGNVVVDRRVFEDVAKVIRSRGGTDEGITPADFATKVATLTEGEGPEDPEAVYIETRALDWLEMPVPGENEGYILLHTTADTDQTYDLFMTTTGTYHPRLAYGTSIDGKFVQTSESIQQLDTDGTQNQQFTFTIPIDAFTPVDGGKQVLVKLSRMTQVTHLDYFYGDTVTPTEALANLRSQVVEIDFNTPNLCGVGELTQNAHYISIRACTHEDEKATRRKRYALSPYNNVSYLYYQDPSTCTRNVWQQGHALRLSTNSTSSMTVCEYPVSHSSSSDYYSDLQYGTTGGRIFGKNKSSSASITVGHLPLPFDIALGANLICVRNFDLSQQNSAQFLFAGCTNLRAIPQLDTANIVDFAGMFYNCQKLRAVPTLAHARGRIFSYMFHKCVALKSVQDWTPEAGLYYDHMFDGCTSLETMPYFKLTGYTNALGREIPGTLSTGYMFCKCSKLTSMSHLDLSTVPNVEHMFEFSGLTSADITIRSGETFVPKMEQYYQRGIEQDFRTGGNPSTRYLFWCCTELTDVSKVVLEGDLALTGVFAGTKITTPPNLSAVTPSNMEYAFAATPIKTMPSFQAIPNNIIWRKSFWNRLKSSDGNGVPGWGDVICRNQLRTVDLRPLGLDAGHRANYSYVENLLYCRDECDVIMEKPDYWVSGDRTVISSDGAYYIHVQDDTTVPIPTETTGGIESIYGGARFIFVPDSVYEEYAATEPWSAFLNTTANLYALDGVTYSSWAQIRYRALWPESQYEVAKATYGIEVPADFAIEVVEDQNGLFNHIDLSTGRFFAWMKAHDLSFADETLQIVILGGAAAGTVTIDKMQDNGLYREIDRYTGEGSVNLMGLYLNSCELGTRAIIHITGTPESD